MEPFHGKAIYQPQGKAGEYSKWAVNFYNGCSAKCEYCYNRHSIMYKILGGDKPILKKSLINEKSAYQIFCDEVNRNILELRYYGLFFNFVSDPFLPETIFLNQKAMRYCIVNNIPVKVLTKQTSWVAPFLNELSINGTIWNTLNTQKLFAFGFTLTGYDELEPGASTNMERVNACIKLHTAGFKTWGSFEPIIDFNTTLTMIGLVKDHCDHFKIGLKSGGTMYDQTETYYFYKSVCEILRRKPIYFKNSFLKVARINRSSLPYYCVDLDYKF